MSQDRLSLYRFDGCPWCERVRAAIDDLGLTVDERDIRRDSTHAEALHAATGRGRVPVLRIESAGEEVRWMPESSDIVRYLYETYGKGRQPTFLASSWPQTLGGLVALLAVLVSFLLDYPARGYLLAVGIVLFVMRNSLPLLRLAGLGPRRR